MLGEVQAALTACWYPFQRRACEILQREASPRLIDPRQGKTCDEAEFGVAQRCIGRSATSV
jgi:hypothetical protein